LLILAVPAAEQVAAVVVIVGVEGEPDIAVILKDALAEDWHPFQVDLTV